MQHFVESLRRQARRELKVLLVRRHRPLRCLTLVEVGNGALHLCDDAAIAENMAGVDDDGCVTGLGEPSDLPAHEWLLGNIRWRSEGPVHAVAQLGDALAKCLFSND